MERQTTPTKKRKRIDDTNEFLPEAPTDEAAKYGSMEFNEILEQEVSNCSCPFENLLELIIS